MEIKAFDYEWGGICDDGFKLEEAHVICREAGYPMGAQLVFIGAQFGKGTGQILLDELECKGNETSVLECEFDPWTKTDCNDHEWVGVSCKLGETSECNREGVRRISLLNIIQEITRDFSIPHDPPYPFCNDVPHLKYFYRNGNAAMGNVSWQVLYVIPIKIVRMEVTKML